MLYRVNNLLTIGRSTLCTLLFSFPLFAGQPIDLYVQSPSTLLLEKSSELSRVLDAQGVTHIRKQQTVNGYPVFGGDYIIHIPAGQNNNPSAITMNGIIYDDLEKDLAQAPSFVFSSTQKQKALAAIKAKHPKEKLRTAPEAKLIVFVDKKNIAHWAYQIRLITTKSIPSYIVDAVTFKPYLAWNDLKTFETITAGGFGGNSRVGRTSYDGIATHLPLLTMQRDPLTQTCYVRNDKAVIKDYRRDWEDIQFSCETVDRNHYNLYWAGYDYSGGGYSPSNDTLYAASVTWDMFQNWYKTPTWVGKDGKAKRLVYFVHDIDANAAFHDEGYIVLGDALQTNKYYPFTTVDIVAHEMAHGFTLQHSNLFYSGQSGGLNESFSDMTGKTAEYFANGAIKNWNLGEVPTDKTKWLRYMDQPSKDCEPGQIPGEDCSIDNMSQISKYSDVHHLSGLYNRIFYLLATSPQWDIRKAYQLMLHANSYYWTETTAFCQAARGVLLAANELGFDEQVLRDVFSQVGIAVDNCTYMGSN